MLRTIGLDHLSIDGRAQPRTTIECFSSGLNYKENLIARLDGADLSPGPLLSASALDCIRRRTSEARPQQVAGLLR